MREMVRHAILVSSLLMGAASGASAQASSTSTGGPVGWQFLHAAVIVESAAISFDGGDGTRRLATRLEMGGRKHAPFGIAWLHLVPKAGLMFTNVRGLPDDSNGFAYGGVDAGARVVVAAHRRVRPFVDVSWGLKQVAERPSGDGRILNLSGKGSRIAFGLEVPITKAGRGLEIGMGVTRGRYTRAEYQREWEDVDVDHRSVSLFVGWSGRFTGISPPWR